MNEIQFLVLKGRNIIAQGKRRRSVALGLDGERENRPCDNVRKSENLISDEEDNHLFPENDVLPFRPNAIIRFVQEFPRTGFSSVSFTQGGVSDRPSRNSALGYYSLTFQAGKIITKLVLKSSLRERGGTSAKRTLG